MNNIFFEIKVPDRNKKVALRRKFNTHAEAKKFADWNYGEGYPYEIIEVEINVKSRTNQ